MKDTVFVCYRSADEAFAALFVERSLADHFGRRAIFRDSRSIAIGTDFPDRIWKALQRCRVLVAIIGPRWLCADPSGARPIDRSDDYVRREIAEALRRDILVVPVLVGEASMPAEQQLPRDIAGLASRQYDHLRRRTAESDVSRLVERLAEALQSTDSAATPWLDLECRPRATRYRNARRSRRSSA